jgi:hypothetical protein
MKTDAANVGAWLHINFSGTVENAKTVAGQFWQWAQGALLTEARRIQDARSPHFVRFGVKVSDEVAAQQAMAEWLLLARD